MDFKHFIPTKIIIGKGCIQKEATLFATYGSKVMVITGQLSAEKNGALAEVLSVLKAKGIEYVHYNQIKPNPTIEAVRQAAQQAKVEKCEFIIAIGGGSALDAAKAVAVLVYNELSNEALFSAKQFREVLPIIAVPTTAGTGSEVTPYSILTNDKIESKSNLVSDQIYPVVAFLDASYTMDLPREITNATVIDAMSHAIEGDLAKKATPMSRILARQSLRLIGECLPKLVTEETLVFEERERLLWASALAGMVIAQSGTTAVHRLGYSLTYFKNIDHGKANGYLLAAYLQFMASTRHEEVQALFNALNIENCDQFKELLNKLLGWPELSEDEMNKFVSKAIKAGNMANTIPEPTEEDLKKIMKDSCRH